MKRLHFNRTYFQSMEQRYRTQLINSVPGIKSVNLVGTRGSDGLENLAIFNSVFHVGANPPYLGMVIRPDSVDRHTWLNIQENGYYSLNQVAAEHAGAAHQTSARYAQNQSEFDAVGFHAVYRDEFYAPLVEEAPISIGMKYVEHHRVDVNNTLVVIGEIADLWVSEELIALDGFVDLAKANILGCIGLDAYVKLELLQRFEYAKPELPPRIKK